MPRTTWLDECVTLAFLQGRLQDRFIAAQKRHAAYKAKGNHWVGATFAQGQVEAFRQALALCDEAWSELERTKGNVKPNDS